MHREVRTDRSGHGLLDDENRLAGTGELRRVLHCSLLDASDARRHAHHHSGLTPTTGVHLLDEVAEHLFAHLEVGDHAVLHRANRPDVAGGAPHHSLGLDADSDGTAVVDIDGDHGGLVEHHAETPHVDQGVRGAEVNGDIPTES